MTKDRARKKAARQRAAVTGERYVVAQRATTKHPPVKHGRLHALTHRVPGVPPHIDGGLQSAGGRTSRARNRARVHGEPRMLVGWQGWIARRFGAATR